MIQIYQSAFANCQGLSTITFPESGKIIIEYLAFGSSPIETLDIKKSVIEFTGLITTSISLISFSCPNDHEYFTVQGGVLFSKDMSVLIMYPPGKLSKQNYEIPNSVSEIASYSFVRSTSDIVFTDGSVIQLFSPSSFAEWKGSTITFPDNCDLKTISKGSFTSASMIKVFTITKNVQTIQEGAFASSGIEEFRVVPGSNYIVRGGVLMANEATITVFPPNLTEFTITRDITTISQSAFARTSVEYIYVERGSLLSTIGENAFALSALKYIDFDPNCPLQHLNRAVFSGCPLINFTFPLNLKTLTGIAFVGSGPPAFSVPEDHPYFCVFDGVLYNKQMTKVMCYPPSKPDETYVYPVSVESDNEYCFYGSAFLKRVVVPVGSKLKTLGHGTYESAANLIVDLTNAKMLETIGVWAFANNRMFTVLRIPDSVSFIAGGAFTNNVNIEKVVLPASLETLSTSAFRGCTRLEYVEFDLYCPLEKIESLTFASSPIKEVAFPWKLQSVTEDAFGGAVTTLKFISKPPEAVLEGFISYTTLRSIYVPCECFDWSPAVNFSGGPPVIIVCCSTIVMVRRRHHIFGFIPLLILE